jgi:hypothetical protein
MTSTKSLEERLLAAAKKAGRDRDALQAMRDYRAEAVRVDANTARLRELRLAKEAADAQAAAAPSASAKKPSRSSKARAS